MPISSGIQAPDFSLPDENNVSRRLSDFRGRPVVLYFYPKDDTPGCTTEACNFRDDYSAYVKQMLLFWGSARIHPNPMRNSRKNIPCRSHCWRMMVTKSAKNTVFGAKKFMGREYDGVMRTTFLIDSNGQYRQSI